VKVCTIVSSPTSWKHPWKPYSSPARRATYRQRPPVVASQSTISVSIPLGPTQRANSAGSVCARSSSAGVASKSRVMRMIGSAGSASIETW
jgi:hypothetical protein